MQALIEGSAVSLALGLVVFVLVAVFLVPYRALQPGPEASDRRRVLRTAAVTGYVAAVAAATLVPFPERGSLTCPDPSAGAQWVPLEVLTRVGDAPAGRLGLDPALLHMALNVALFVPLGVLLVRLWGMPLGRVLVVAGVLSLGIELTQLTGVWFVYDCAYRVFDVDDILANSLGAVAGALLAPRLPRWGHG